MKTSAVGAAHLKIEAVYQYQLETKKLIRVLRVDSRLPVFLRASVVKSNVSTDRFHCARIYNS
jgi:hypothetical protein